MNILLLSVGTRNKIVQYFKKELDTTVNVLNAIGDIRVIDFNNLTQTSANKLIASCRVLVSYQTDEYQRAIKQNRRYIC